MLLVRAKSGSQGQNGQLIAGQGNGPWSRSVPTHTLDDGHMLDTHQGLNLGFYRIKIILQENKAKSTTTTLYFPFVFFWWGRGRWELDIHKSILQDVSNKIHLSKI